MESESETPEVEKVRQLEEQLKYPGIHEVLLLHAQNAYLTKQYTHSRYLAEAQAHMIKGLQKVSRDVSKYTMQTQAYMGRLHGTIWAVPAGRWGSAMRWISTVMTGLILFAIIAYFYLHPEVVSRMQDFIAANSTVIIIAILALAIALVYMFRRRSRKR